MNGQFCTSAAGARVKGAELIWKDWGWHLQQFTAKSGLEVWTGIRSWALVGWRAS